MHQAIERTVDASSYDAIGWSGDGPAFPRRDQSADPDAVRWLDPGQQQSWRSLIQMMMTLPAALEADLQERAGLTTFEYLVLSGLSEAPDRTLRLSNLAAAANSSLSRLSHVVTRLEAKGWVTRRTCASDGRGTEAVLTGDGWRKVAASAPGHVQAVRRLVVDHLSAAELRQLGKIAAKISDNVVRPAGSTGRVAGRDLTSRLPQIRG